MMRWTNLAKWSLLFLLPGCEAGNVRYDEAPPPREAPSSKAQPSDPLLAPSSDAAIRGLTRQPPLQKVRERTQAHYRTSVTKVADGTEFSQGSASLEIRYTADRPRALFTLQAFSASDQLTIALPLDVEALPALATTAVDSVVSAPAVLRRARGSQLAPAKKLVWERTQEAGRRARFHGRLLDDGGTASAEFETELAISCLVPPALLGVEPNGHSESPGVTLLIADEEFKSPFCAKFSGLL